MNKEAIEAAWKASCGEIEAVIGMSIDMKLDRQKGKTAGETKRDFYIDIAKAAYEAGCKRGFAEAKALFGE